MFSKKEDLKDKDDTYWKEKLSEEQYTILRKKGTERPFSGEYYHNEEKGMYLCAACGNKLFSSDKKYDSGTGWPSFTHPVENENIETAADESIPNMERTEIMCSNCGGHLGHVFDDGPKGNKRYCVNSRALAFQNEQS